MNICSIKPIRFDRDSSGRSGSHTSKEKINKFSRKIKLMQNKFQKILIDSIMYLSLATSRLIVTHLAPRENLLFEDMIE